MYCERRVKARWEEWINHLATSYFIINLKKKEYVPRIYDDVFCIPTDNIIKEICNEGSVFRAVYAAVEWWVEHGWM